MAHDVTMADRAGNADLACEQAGRVDNAPEPVDLELPRGWLCRLELRRVPDGAYTGRAELSCPHGVRRCLLLILPQPCREAALERLKFRARHFIDGWSNGAQGEGTSLGLIGR